MTNILKSNGNHYKKKNKIPMKVWLSYLFIVTLITGSISLARYTVSTSGEATMHVAKLSVSANLKDGSKELTLSRENNNCEFEIKNNSKVSVKYNIILNNVPNNVNINMLIGGKEIKLNSDNKKLVSDAIKLGVGKKETCKLSFQADDNIDIEENKISVQVRFEQAN